MPTKEIPLTTYIVRSNKASTPLGSPAVLALKSGGPTSRVFARVPLDKIPLDADISNAVVEFYSDRDIAGTGTEDVRVHEVVDPWKASVKWSNQPAIGALLDTASVADPGRGSLYSLDVTTWAQGRPRNGLRFDTTSGTHYLSGSSAARLKPVLVVTYTIPPVTPGSLVPDGGSVSVPAPILTYAGDEDMTQQIIEFSTDEGETISYTYGPSAATKGYYDPALDAGANPVLVDGGAGIWWRATTIGPDGTSDPSDWAYYEYDSLPDVTIINPANGSTTDDGTPPLEWTVESERQTAWKASLKEGDTVLSKEDWDGTDATRTWTASKGVPVPGGAGLYTLEVQDDITPRVAAVDAPTTVKVTSSFTTVDAGAGPAIDSLTYTFDDPVPVLSGTRSLGTPDEVALYRDGVQVPLWDEDGNVYKWAPGTVFFTGNDFSIPDYTAEPRATHTWKVKVRSGGVTSADGPTVTQEVWTTGAWLVDPRTGDRVDVQGYNEFPVIEQETTEAAVLHFPINGGTVVEPKRRRLVRTTRQGTISGTVLNEHEGILEGWSEADSGLKYRLIFGKVNWSVILGDYSPTDVLYQDVSLSANRVIISLSWWQRLEDV
jgi:hypothetical protein